MIACEGGNLNVVHLLVEKQANICVKNKVLPTWTDISFVYCIIINVCMHSLM